jgi:hypothetical protein
MTMGKKAKHTAGRQKPLSFRLAAFDSQKNISLKISPCILKNCLYNRNMN